MKISKTSRILSVFHLFLHCQEVSYQDITDLMEVSEKTIYRDICLLKQSGIIFTRFSKKQNAFVLLPGACPPPMFPENKSRKLYLEKLIRLCTMMAQIEKAKNPVEWYQEHYTTLSLRTRQRDFAELAKIGYCIVYDREGGYKRERNQYYCEFPYDAYDLETFF